MAMSRRSKEGDLILLYLEQTYEPDEVIALLGWDTITLLEAIETTILEDEDTRAHLLSVLKQEGFSVDDIK